MIHLTLFDIYILTGVVYWPVGIAIAGASLFLAFRYTKGWLWRTLAILMAAGCLYPLLYIGEVY